jgi:Domain of unknown function (DUF4055)
MPNVDFVRDEVTQLLSKWYLIRDCLSGQEAVKKAGDLYLPRPNVEDKSEENKKRFLAYLLRAIFYNVTSRTLDGLVGQVFSKDPVIDTPAIMEPMKVDVDGSGVSLLQQAQSTLAKVLAYGRCAILIDYPNVQVPASRAQQLAGFVRPVILSFSPWDVINWRTVTIGAKKILSLVVIKENGLIEDDGFEIKTTEQWRELVLIDGVYNVRLWRKDEQLQPYIFEQFIPVDASGAVFTEIPFTFIGSVNNDPSPDKPPIYDLAALNIAHYRNSADYEESCYIVGQPTPYFAGLTKKWVDDVMGGKVYLGARAAIPLPEGGTAGLLQAAPNSMPFEAMEHKEKQMVALGARLVEDKGVARTLGEAKLEESGEISVLGTVAKNVANAYQYALRIASRFYGSTEETKILFEIETDMMLGQMSAQDRAQLIAEWQGGAISFEEMRYNLRKAGVAYLEDEEAIEQIGSTTGPNLDDENDDPAGGDGN